MSYHVHFGAGKLGLGFVLPILRDLKVPVAILQRPGSPEWAQLAPNSDNTVSFSVNSSHVLSCAYISEKSDPAHLRHLLDQGVHLFVSTRCVHILQAVLQRAHSISTAVGPQGLAEVITGLELPPIYFRQVPVYCFENDFKAVADFKNHLAQTAPKLSVISVMCDRICTARDITGDHINVVTEEYPGSAVVLCSQQPSCHPFTSPGATRRACTPSTVILAHNAAEESFYYNRKYSLLNGVHYTMAVYAYGVLMEQGVTSSEWLDVPLPIWKKEARNAETLNLLIELRILYLLHLTDATTLASIYNTYDKKTIFQEMKGLSLNILNRIASTNDVTGRILNLKNQAAVRTKFEQHFLPLHQFVNKGGDFQFVELGIARHSAYVTALRGWESKIRSSALAYGIDLPRESVECTLPIKVGVNSAPPFSSGALPVQAR